MIWESVGLFRRLCSVVGRGCLMMTQLLASDRLCDDGEGRSHLGSLCSMAALGPRFGRVSQVLMMVA